jgi:Glycosyltransferase
MKVAVVVPDGLKGKGGIARVTEYLVREVPRVAPDVHIAVVSTRLVSTPLVNHISSLVSLLHFAVSCVRREYDLVHINVAPKGSTWRKMVFGRIARIAAIPVILHLHGSGYDEFFRSQGATRRSFISRFFNSADAVIALGSYWKSFLHAELGVSSDRIHVVSNGVPENKAQADPAHETALLATLGLVGERKGTDVLLEALSLLPKHLKWRAIVAGNGEVARYRQLSDELGLSGKVEFLGWVSEEEGRAILSSADVFMLPSRRENQPVAILEAMAAGLPVVSTSVGAIPEQVEHGRSGILVPAGDAQQLSGALETLLESQALRLEMGRRGKQIFHERYSIARTSADIVNIYKLCFRGVNVVNDCAFDL